MSKERFVELLVKQGANVQPDQQVLILAEPSCVDLVEIAAEFCYERGARYVDYDVAVPSVARAHVLKASPDRVNFVPTYQTVRMDQLVDSRGALIALRSQDEPDLYEDFDEAQQKKLNGMLVARRDAVRRYRDEGVLKRQVGWCLAGPPSPKWAAKIYPELTPEQAVEALWQEIFKMTFAHESDCLARWSAHLDLLAERTEKLNRMRVRQLRFVSEKNDTDLTVALSAEANWVSGRKQTAHGIDVCLNIPTFEVFTTPDWRGTQGRVSTTRPVMINGTLVEGLKMVFKDGEIVETSATKNGSAYEALINTPGDPTARRLGEVALVGVDSPIFQSGRVFQHTLYDENAACHIATGMAYTVGIREGDKLDPERLDELGFNRQAKTHQDVMISDESTTVLADGKEILVDGSWVI
ncbi:MAG: aminopeptidase [Vulcanimicrobiota bacterium]